MKAINDSVKEKISIIRFNEDYINTIVSIDISTLNIIPSSIQYPIWNSSRKCKVAVYNFIKEYLNESN